MDYQTARNLLIKQSGTSDPAADTFLARLQTLKPPVPGQVTSLLLALTAVADAARHEPTLERPLACSLFDLAYESRQCYERGRRSGVEWPPLLDEDLQRIAIAARKVFAGSA